ncbi:hypothetical protein B0I18_1094 [Taibaiella chishuiensis]|uniref:Uncharacterized protein n=1 Tax=Taibaiella chishuiensis TaxID=1434707 RepID=A0A2P8CYE6_9BACT|nr:hypothetical protein B0I18_1094 [Taibaiella chishuiensis]
MGQIPCFKRRVNNFLYSKRIKDFRATPVFPENFQHILQ